MREAVLRDLPETGRPPDFAALFPPRRGTRTLTPRTAALLHDVLRYLGEVGRARIAALGTRAVNEGDDDLFTALPEFTWRQTAVWRARFVACFEHLAARLAAGRLPEPDTPGREFALWLALLQAELLHELQPDLVARAVAAVPPAPGDFDWPDCRRRLLRHGCLPLLLHREFAGLEDPRHRANRLLDLGDYRPDAWFAGFGATPGTLGAASEGCAPGAMPKGR